MSPFGSIATIYRAEVSVPIDVYERFGHTKEYEQHSQRAGRIVEVSGQNSYSSVEEWGETPVRRNAEDFIDFWHNRILQWQAEMRSNP